MTLEEAITKCLIGEEHLDQAEYEQVGEWLEELNKVKQELNKVSQEVEVYKKALELTCESLSDKTACEWGYDEACMACRQRLGSIRTTSCVDFIKNFYLQKAREE